MDKFFFGSQIRQIIIMTVAVITSAMLVFHGSPAYSGWSFLANPHPEIETAPIDVQKMMREIKGDLDCAKYVHAHYQVYQQQYPDFTSTNKKDDAFTDWQIHFAGPDNSKLVFCIVENAKLEFSMRTLEYNWPMSDLTFCGVFSRLPETEIEKFWYNRTKILAEFASNNNVQAAHFLLSNAQHFNVTHVGFTPQVEYFLRYSFEPPNRRSSGGP